MKLKRIATLLLTLTLAFGGVPALTASAAEWEQDPGQTVSIEDQDTPLAEADGETDAVITAAPSHTGETVNANLNDAALTDGETFTDCIINGWIAIDARKDITFVNCKINKSVGITTSNIKFIGCTTVDEFNVNNATGLVFKDTSFTRKLWMTDTKNCEVTGCRFIGSDNPYPLNLTRDNGSTVTNCVISKNGTDSSHEDDFIRVVDCVGTTVTGSTMFRMELAGGQNNVFTNNITKSVLVKDTSNPKVSGNKVENPPAERPFLVENVTGGEISGNTLTNVGTSSTGGSEGIILQTCNDVAVKNNVISGINGQPDHNGIGVVAAKCGGNIEISGNTITNTNYHGIELIEQKADAVYTISGNKITNAGKDGIAVRDDGATVYKVIVSSNTINGAKVGMDLCGTGLTVEGGSNKISNIQGNGIGFLGCKATLAGDEVMNWGNMGLAIYMNEGKTKGADVTITSVKVGQETINEISKDGNRMPLNIGPNCKLSMDSCIIQNESNILVFGDASTTVSSKDTIFITADKNFMHPNPIALSGNHESLPFNTITGISYTGNSVRAEGYSIVEGGAVIDGAKIKGNLSGSSFTAEYPARDSSEVGIYIKDAYGNILCVNSSFIEGMAPVDTTQIRAFVARLYTIILGREAEEAGLEDWTNRLATRTASASQVAGGIIFSDEFKQKNYCNEHFLQTLYLGLFDRAYDEGGYRDWLNRMEKEGLSRERVVNGFFLGDEFKNLCEAYGMSVGEPWADAEYGTIPKGACSHAGCGKEAPVVTWVTHLYGTALHRTPDAGGLEDWINWTASHRFTGRDVITFFFTSEEYVNVLKLDDDQFLTDLYNAIFDRDPDAGGFADWQNRMKNEGYSRVDVINGFAGSDEFRNTCHRIGIEVGR